MSLKVQNDYDFLSETHFFVEKYFWSKPKLPRHISAPTSSAYHIVSYADFMSWTAMDAQNIFRQKHIIITDGPIETMAFNREGVEKLGDWNTVRTIQDLSIPVEDTYAIRHRKRSLKDLLSHANMENGRVLNALDFKIVTSPSPDDRIASDAFVWNNTQGMLIFDQDYDYPIKEFRWGLAATKGAQHAWHVDADGVATAVIIKTGGKWWVTASPKHRGLSGDCYTLTEKSTTQYDPSFGDMENWNLEAIHLRPGMQL